MGNFSPYSEEWEKQHIQRQMEDIREKQKNDPWPLRLLVKAHRRGKRHPHKEQEQSAETTGGGMEEWLRPICTSRTKR